jgi:ABC-type transporter Mla subunit MlaD
MTPGSRDAPELAENGTLSQKNVGDVQQVDRVLGAFDEPTRNAFKRFLIDTSKALDGRGSDINIAIGHLAPTAESTADLMEILDRQRGALSRLVRDSGVTLRAMADRGDDLRTLITAGNEVFAATASRNRQLTQTVQLLPNFLRQTRAALDDIDSAARAAAPTLRALRPVIPLLRPALDETAKLAPELKRTFDALNPAISAANVGLPALNRILLAAHPALKTLYVAGRELVPVAELLRLYRRDVLSALAKVGSATNYDYPTPDGSGQKVLRVTIPINEESVYGVTQRLGSNRTNAYPRPGALDDLATGLKSFDCRNVNNPQTLPVLGQPPPCVEQDPWKFRRVSRSFPHVKLDKK